MAYAVYSQVYLAISLDEDEKIFKIGETTNIARRQMQLKDFEICLWADLKSQSKADRLFVESYLRIKILEHTDIRLLGQDYFSYTDTKIYNEILDNFEYIRPNCHIGDKVKVGDFVEVKNSNIGNGTKIPHLAYIGDTDAGEKINFGCGSIMVNYDGKKKHRTVVEDGVFVGCNANLVAPVTVKKGSYIAAGSTITKDVPEEVLAVARARQTVIEGWIEKRK